METGTTESGREALATFLRERLDALGWQQKKLAERAQLSTATVSELLHARQGLTAETAEKLANVFELRCTSQQLLKMAGILPSTYIEPAQRDLAVSMFMSLDARQQELVLDFMNMLRTRGLVDAERRTRKT